MNRPPHKPLVVHIRNGLSRCPTTHHHPHHPLRQPPPPPRLLDVQGKSASEKAGVVLEALYEARPPPPPVTPPPTYLHNALNVRAYEGDRSVVEQSFHRMADGTACVDRGVSMAVTYVRCITPPIPSARTVGIRESQSRGIVRVRVMKRARGSRSDDTVASALRQPGMLCGEGSWVM